MARFLWRRHRGRGRRCITAGCNQAFCLATPGAGAGRRGGRSCRCPTTSTTRCGSTCRASRARASALPARARRRAGSGRCRGADRPEDPRHRAGDAQQPDRRRSIRRRHRASSTSSARRHGSGPGAGRDLSRFPADRRRRRTGSSAIPTGADTLVHLYSFSKVFCLTGYRVGVDRRGPPLVAEIAKAMDTVAICAPRIGPDGGDLRHRASRRLAARQHGADARAPGRLLKAFARNDLGYELVSAGAYFAYLDAIPSTAARRRRSRGGWPTEQNVLALPGSMFGPGQEEYLRVAFANVEAAAMPALAERLAADAARGWHSGESTARCSPSAVTPAKAGSRGDGTPSLRPWIRLSPDDDRGKATRPRVVSIHFPRPAWLGCGGHGWRGGLGRARKAGQ